MLTWQSNEGLAFDKNTLEESDKTMNRVLKTRKFVFKMMNFAGLALSIRA